MSQEPFSPVDHIKRIQSMPEFELREQLLSFDSSLYIFQVNFVDLDSAIHAYVGDPYDLLTCMGNEQNLLVVRREILRRLHNFVASAQSLIDHTRRLHDKLYAENSRFPEYQSRIDSDFKIDGLTQFVIGLRQFCQHRKSPDIGVRESFKRVGDTFVGERIVFLSPKSLLEMDSWKGSAKAFITDSDPEGIDVRKVVCDYRNKVIVFYHWFRSRLGEIHLEELDRLHEQEAVLHRYELGLQVNAALNPAIDSDRRPTDVFFGVLSQMEISALTTQSLDPKARAAAVIGLIERSFSISDDIKDKIVLLCQRPDFFTPHTAEV